jgi:membrane protein DedA with SNARE-associated domain
MEELIRQFFSQYAYQPMLVYSAICGFMMLSAFGLPLPEEVVLVSAGFLGYMSMHPDRYPPPPGATTQVNVYVLAAVSFIAVMSSDYLIYYLGRRFGPRLFKMRWFARLMPQKTLERVQKWMWEYGSWTVIVFRFTPGVRFPGHLTCGAMGLSPWRFIAIDWLAAGLSVPTQVLLVSFYGEYILKYFTQFKIYLLSTIAIALLIYFTSKYLNKKFGISAQTSSVTQNPNPNDVSRPAP